jgi:predicted Zn-dependent protease with MMP-like domain/Flp pilus assembly protein TadD
MSDELETPEDALEHAEAALKADAADLDAALLKTAALAELGRVEDAEGFARTLLQRHPKDPDVRLSAAGLLIRYSGEDRDRIEEGLTLLNKLDRDENEGVRFEALLLAGIALNALGEFSDAVDALEKALKIFPDDPEAQLEHALALFEAARFEEAKKALEPLTDEPAAWHHLGLIAERRGETEAARRFFDKARRLDPELYPKPVHLSEAEFDKAVSDAIAKLPPQTQDALTNATIAVERIPTDEDLDGGRLSPTMLGIFHGTPVDRRSPLSDVDHRTAVIKLFQANLERLATSREELVEEIGVTLLHEVGHLMGLDEDELYERGLD